MKKSIKETPKNKSINKNNTRKYSAKKAGYKEDVYNKEEQINYAKSEIAKTNRKNTSGPKS